MTKTARRGMDPNRPYECKYDWPDDCFVQCGDSGVVFSPNGNYRTAFFEAFPSDPDTFIRGEGNTVEEAEQKAWKKLQRQSKCTHPAYDRRGYTNGAAFCICCGLFRASLFEPTTTCSVCCKKTNWMHHKGEWYCEEHAPSEEEWEEAIRAKIASDKTTNWKNHE